MDNIIGNKPILEVLKANGIEADQRMAAAFSLIGDRTYNDETIFLALRRLNSIAARILPGPLEAAAPENYLNEPSRHDKRGPIGKNSGYLDKVMRAVLARARKSGSLGVRDFLKAVIDFGLPLGEDSLSRPRIVDLLVKHYSGDWDTPLSQVPSALTALDCLRRAAEPTEDFQYMLMLSGDQVVFRVASILDDLVQEGSSGLLLPQRAILTHFKEHFGGFTADEIEELESLLNSPQSKEADFQRFFERHTHFFRRWDYREVYPHIALARDEGLLVPDFILTDRELQRAAILDLKLPSPKIIRRQHNRDRFSASIMEARTQLLRYRDWFREQNNRKALVGKVGMEIYEPELIVVVGRSSEFRDEFDRQRLKADNPDIEVVTYEDILAYAKRRRITIQG
jgi:Shedu protein SduA, C-terminal